MATNANEETKIEAPKETVQMSATPAPVQPVTWEQAQANAVEASKRTDANGVTTPPVSMPDAPATTAAAPVATPPPTDYKYNQETGKYEAQAPVVQPKVETPKPVETPKRPAPVDFNVSAGREEEIQKNLASITATNPALTQDRAKFDAAFGYSTADAGKKALLDSFYDSKRPKTQDEMYAMLSSGAQILGEASKTPEFASAKKRFDAVQAYKSFSVPQFSSALAKGTVIPGSQAYKDLMSNPESADKIRKAEAMNRINKKTVADEDKRESVMSEIKSTTFGQAVADGFIDPQEADALMSTPEIVAKQKEIEPLKNKYDELKADYENIETDTKKEFEASGKSRSYINAKISERRKDTYRDLSVLESRYNNAVGALADMKKNQAEVLSLNKDLWSAERGFEKQKELAQFQSELKDEGIETQVIKDDATGKQTLINSRTGEIINTYDTGAKPGSGTAFQQIKQTDELGRETVVGYFDPATGRSTYYGADVISPKSSVTGGASVTASGSSDLRDAVSKYPNEASLKNNNPAGITYNETFANTLRNAGVKFEKGTARPSAEGGNYFTFPNVEEGFKAYDILWSSPSYQNLTVGKALSRWGTGALPGVDVNKKVSELSDGELEQLQIAQIKKESPGMFKELTSRGIIGAGGRNFGESETVGFDDKKAALYENVLKWDAKTLNAKGYSTPEARATITNEALAWASAGGETAKTKSEREKSSREAVIDRIDKLNAGQTAKDFKLGKPNIQKVIANAEQDTAASDIALIFGFMKQQDPQSTVREGEFATAQNSGGIPDSVRNAYNKAISGQRLQPAQRADFVNTSISAFKTQLAAYNEEIRNAKTIAESLGIDTKAFPKEETFVRKFKDGTALEYDGLGKYRYKGKTGGWSGWQDEGTPIRNAESGKKPSALERAKALRNK